jgi:hypothetical protein
MSGLIDDDPASQEARAGRERDPDDARQLQRRLQNRRYRESHPEQNAATRRRWVGANRDRVREYNRQWRAKNLERARELNRESARRAALRVKREAEQQARGRARAKSWREGHPDEVRDYQTRWVEQNRAKVRGYYNDYYRTHRDEVNARAAARRDADAECMKQARKAWAERNKDRLAELQRERRKDPDIYQAQLEANAAARRLKRRLQNAGLPPKQLRPVTAAERRAHEQVAEAYFSDPTLAEHVRQSAVFTETLTAHLRVHEPQAREFAAAYSASRSPLGLPPVEVDGVMYARVVEVVLAGLPHAELLTSRDIVGAVRSSRAILQREARERQFEHLLRAVVAHVNNQRGRLELDVEMENCARVRRDLPRVQTDALLVQLALQEVVGRVLTNRLTVADIQSVCRSAKTRVMTPIAGHLSGASASVRDTGTVFGRLGSSGIVPNS